MNPVTANIPSGNQLPADVASAGISENIGAQVPLNVILTDSEGNKVISKDWFKDGRPVVLVMAYYSCPMLCNMVLTGVADAVKTMPGNVGEKYRIITVSIDPSDTPESARKFSSKYIGAVGNKVKNNGWEFLVGSESEVKRIGDAVGFRYKYIPRNKEYAHGAGIMVLTPDGKLSRCLYGIEYKPRDFKLAILEASDRRLVSTTERIMMFCYAYDSHSQGYALVAVNIMKLGGIVTVIVLGGAIIWLNFKYKDRKKYHG
ncbi:SCO family protein [bacterium]|nr:SCO family protein [bacterium]